MFAHKKLVAFVAIAVTITTVLSACAPPTPVVVEKEVVVEKPVVETVVVEVEKEVVVEKPVEVEKVVVVTPTPVPGRQVIIVAIARTPLTLDPADYRHRETETVIRNMFDGLVTRDTRSGVHLELAESMEWLDDATLEVKLRQGVKFHDGVEMTADDVVFTFERIIGPARVSSPRCSRWRRWMTTPS